MDAPFDRGEIDRSSIEATERLRARLSGRPPAAAPQRRANVLPWVVAGGLFVFTAGMIANPWFETRVRSGLPSAAPAAAPATNSVDVAALQGRIAQMEARIGPAAAGVPVERLARTEARIETSTDQIARDADRIDRLTSELATLSATLASERERSEAAVTAATAAADRAEAMLVLVLARRAIDGGRAFGALDPMLRTSFGGRYPAAVKSVAALGAAPVTPETLRRDLEALRGSLGGAPAAGGRVSWWDALTNTLASVTSTAPAATTPLAAATLALQRDDVRTAAAQLRRLPGTRPAALNNWLSAADRLIAGQDGLAVLEAGVLLPPAAPPPKTGSGA
jgi:hypothetical protein